MREMILCKLGEVVLKGLNRRSFEDKLIGNLRRRTAKCGNFRIYSKQSTIYVEPVNDESDLAAAPADERPDMVYDSLHETDLALFGAGKEAEHGI